MFYKRTFFSSLLFIISHQLVAQGFVNNGAYISITGSAYIYINGGAATGNFTNQDANGFTGTVANGGTIDVTGDWTNSSASNVFSGNNGTVELVGSNRQNINGTTTTWFNNVNLGGSGNKFLNVYTLMGGGYASPNGSLNMNSQPLILNSNTLEMTNPSAIAITRTTGYIESETHAATNPSIIQWDSTITGSYVFWFGDTLSGNYLPLTITRNVAAASITIYASTRATASSDNAPWPPTVTNMNDSATGLPGAIPDVIDRWWNIASTIPFVADLNFTYQVPENTTTTTPLGTFAAQNWSGAIWLPQAGSGSGVASGTGTVAATHQSVGGTIGTPWVLSNILTPLPVKLLSFNAVADNDKVYITWATASEINSDYFMVQKSTDGYDFENVVRKEAAGNSTWQINYNAIDSFPYTGLSYYRLKQVDKNGASNYSQNVAVYFNRQNRFDFVYVTVNNSGTMTMMFTDNTSEPCMINIYDVLGKELYNENITTASGFNKHDINIESLAHGIYYVSISIDYQRETKKILY